MEKYLKWSKEPYGGEKNPPKDPVTPLAGDWPLAFLKRNKRGEFLDPEGRRLSLPILHPDRIDFGKELKAVQHTLNNLTPEQENIGIFYGTGVPTKQWTPVIDRLIDSYGISPVYAARILAAVQMAINDTMIVVWDLKYKWDTARPIQYDHSLEPLLCTPRFPSYPSGHASMSGCAEVVLSYFFPKEASKLKRFAEEDAISRLYTGVHFPVDNDEGLKLGRSIGNSIVQHLQDQRVMDGAIDQPQETFRNADFFSAEFNQFIPYDFSADCTSNVRSGKEFSQRRIAPDFTKSGPSKPKLFY
ncbi:vanadium-dependent haloperoxidase [Jeotgalibacillus sp. S-D1]|uniref:vanadium-dependent haloperoxidase n=1 Tax=Jeotgalibacillus sp. S-D1 TaxID=2552189 RepID=UPI001F0EA6B1|nr:vanadium-dependent haloperoxidase [Jeotgalibacillus sp. S-D1]